MNDAPRHSSATKSDRIPDELERFVRHDTYALLIKGKAGTGKTTLSLTILKTLGQASNFFYISTRVSPRQTLHLLSMVGTICSNNKTSTHLGQ